MGMYDTMKQMGTPAGVAPTPNPQMGGANGGSFAQKQMLQKNPMMKRPGMSQGAPMGNLAQAAGGVAQAMRPNPMTGARPALGQAQAGAGGSNLMQQQNALKVKNAQAAATGGAIGGSYDEMVKSNPMLQNARQTGMNAGQDMSWMDKPGAISLPQGYGQTPPIRADKPQYGMQDVASRMGYGAPPQTSLQNAPFTGEQPGSNGFQAMMEEYGGQRPDIVRGGIGPSAQMFGGQPMDEMQQAPVIMDENGLEPRRGAR